MTAPCEKSAPRKWTPRVRLPIACREVRMELHGLTSDDTYQTMFEMTRRYRHRYSPLLRCYFTSVTRRRARLEEGDNVAGDEPSVAISTHVGEESVQSPLVRFDSFTFDATGAPYSAHLETFFESEFLRRMVIRTAEQAIRPEASLPELVAFRGCSSSNPRSFALPMNTESSSMPNGLLLRHYVHEGSRTASFLVGSSITKRFVIIDPLFVLQDYPTQQFNDAEKLIHQDGWTLVAVALTHIYFDVLTGHSHWIRAYPSARILASPLMVDYCDGLSFVLQSALMLDEQLSLVATSTPVLSDEAACIELLWCSSALHNVPLKLCVFSGPSVPLDGLPRMDVHGIASVSGASLSPAKRLHRAFEALVFVFEHYFGGSFDFDAAHDGTMVFPSHGSYNHITHQLDPHWCAHVADLKRYSHVKRVWQMFALCGGGNRSMLSDCDAVATRRKMYDDFVEYVCTKQASLPVGPWFEANRNRNWADVCSVVADRRGAAVGTSAPPRRVISAAASGITHHPLRIDVRNIDDFVRCNVQNTPEAAVNVPLTLPGFRFGAKKAELWLECLIPSSLSRLCVICGKTGDFPEVRWRIARLGIPVAALELTTPPLLVPAASASGWDRVVTNRQLEQLDVHQRCLVEPAVDVWIVDCRTAYEFRNGSHQRSVHAALSELSLSFAASWNCRFAEEGGSSFNFFESLLKSIPRPLGWNREAQSRHICFYCAAGYRSHIAVTLLQVAAAVADYCGDWPSASLRVNDVAGGAFQIMTHRPDLWMVKDRSIICTS